jgi:hypothetical protein
MANKRPRMATSRMAVVAGPKNVVQSNATWAISVSSSASTIGSTKFGVAVARAANGGIAKEYDKRGETKVKALTAEGWSSMERQVCFLLEGEVEEPAVVVLVLEGLPCVVWRAGLTNPKASLTIRTIKRTARHLNCIVGALCCFY